MERQQLCGNIHSDLARATCAKCQEIAKAQAEVDEARSHYTEEEWRNLLNEFTRYMASKN